MLFHKYLILKGLDLKNKREKAGFTQKELADLIGKSMRTIITWEKSEELSQSQETIINSIFSQYENTSLSNFRVNEPREIFNTKSGNNIEELANGKFLLTVPLVPYKAQATYVSEFMDADFISDLTKVSFLLIPTNCSE